MPAVLVAVARLCAMRSMSGRAAPVHPHGILSILCMAAKYCEAFLALVDDKVVSYSVSEWQRRNLRCKTYQNCFWLLVIGELSHMASYGHANLKPTVVFGSALGPQGDECIINCDVHVKRLFFAVLSTWAYRLQKRLTKTVRKRIKKSKATVRKYVDRHGRKRVCQT